MKKIILAVLFCALAAAAGAQNTVLSIRKEYQEVHEWMQRMTPDEEMVKFDIYGNTWVHPCAPDVRLNPSVSSITSAVKVLILYNGENSARKDWFFGFYYYLCRIILEILFVCSAALL